MSAAQIEDETPDLTIPVTRRDRSGDRVTFTLDDDPRILVAVRPKQAKLISLLTNMGDLDQVDEFAASAALIEMLWTVLDDDSTAHLRGRFDDPDDDCDVDVVEPIIHSLVGLWYRRPTGRPGASSGSSTTTGKPSTEPALFPG